MRIRIPALLITLSLLFIFIQSNAFCGQKLKSKKGGNMLKGKSVAMIIASDKFRDEEYQKPRAIFEKEGASITVFSSSLNESTGMLGAKAKPDKLIKDLNVDNFDAVVFVGGMGSSEYWDDKTAHDIAKKSVEKGKILSAICIAPVTLANAGVLKGKKGTVWTDDKGDIKKKFTSKGVNYTGKTVEIDGKIITGNGPDAAEEFGKAIVNSLK